MIVSSVALSDELTREKTERCGSQTVVLSKIINGLGKFLSRADP